MPRKRNPENKGLPARWKHTHGAYYYQVPPGLEAQWDNKKTFRLGKTLPEAYKAWAARLESIDGAKTIGQLFDRYALEVIPTKAPRTQVENTRALGRLRAVFADMPLTSVTPQHMYQYVDKAKLKIPARKEVKLFSAVFSKAVSWGYMNRHPLKGEIPMEGDKPRTRYVEDWEVIECLALPSSKANASVRVIQSYIRVKLLTGLRRGDMLRLKPAKFTELGIPVKPNKTKKTTGEGHTIEWSDALREAVATAMEARPTQTTEFLFCNSSGEGYINEAKGTASGWDSNWQRFMERVMKETEVKERFTEHDLRAKCASDAETLEHAQAQLSHADSRITAKVYRRKPTIVKPLR